jgi:hypothetical protein
MPSVSTKGAREYCLKTAMIVETVQMALIAAITLEGHPGWR